MESKAGQENGTETESDRIVVVPPLEDPVSKQPHHRLTREEIANYQQEKEFQRLKEMLVEAHAQLDTLDRKLAHEKASNRKKDDQIKFMRYRLADLVMFLEDVLTFREPVTETELKRLISRVKGARDYQGSEGGSS